MAVLASACDEVPRDPYIPIDADRPVVPAAQLVDPARHTEDPVIGHAEVTLTNGSSPTLADLQDLDLSGCLDLAIVHNRDQRQRELLEDQARLRRTAAFREVFDPRLEAGYTIQEGSNVGDGRLAVSGKLWGFELEPFLDVTYREDDISFATFDDRYQTSVGVVLARQVLRLSEDLRQRLPVTRSTRDVHKAVNDRMRELRNLILAVTRSFYDVQRLQRRIQIREARVADAEEFLADVEKLVPQVKAQVEATNARIDLNRAKADLLREQTAHRNAMDNLLDLMGARIEVGASIRAEDVALWPGLDLDPDGDIIIVQNEHERVLNQLLDMEVLRQESVISRDAVLPDLRAELRVQRETEGSDPFDDSLFEDDSVTLGFRLDLPLDGHLAERANYQRNLLRLQEQNLELVDIRRDLVKNLRRQYRRIQELELQVALAEERQAAEAAKLTSSLQRYEDGELDNLEVTRAKAAAEDAELSLLERRIDRILAVAEYRALVPTPPDAERTGVESTPEQEATSQGAEPEAATP